MLEAPYWSDFTNGNSNTNAEPRLFKQLGFLRVFRTCPDLSWDHRDFPQSLNVNARILAWNGPWLLPLQSLSCSPSAIIYSYQLSLRQINYYLSIHVSNNNQSNYILITLQRLLYIFYDRGKKYHLILIKIIKKEESHVRAEPTDAIYPTQWYSAVLIPCYPFSQEIVLSIYPFTGIENKRQNNIKVNSQTQLWEGVKWISLAQDRDKWRALTNAVTNVKVP